MFQHNLLDDSQIGFGFFYFFAIGSFGVSWKPIKVIHFLGLFELICIREMGKWGETCYLSRLGGQRKYFDIQASFAFNSPTQMFSLSTPSDLALNNNSKNEEKQL